MNRDRFFQRYYVSMNQIRRRRFNFFDNYERMDTNSTAYYVRSLYRSAFTTYTMPSLIFSIQLKPWKMIRMTLGRQRNLSTPWFDSFSRCRNKIKEIFQRTVDFWPSLDTVHSSTPVISDRWLDNQSIIHRPTCYDLKLTTIHLRCSSTVNKNWKLTRACSVMQHENHCSHTSLTILLAW